MGMPKASVLPVPVCAMPTTSRPVSMTGIDCACTGVGSVKPISITAASERSETPSARNASGASAVSMSSSGGPSSTGSVAVSSVAAGEEPLPFEERLRPRPPRRPRRLRFAGAASGVASVVASSVGVAVVGARPSSAGGSSPASGAASSLPRSGRLRRPPTHTRGVVRGPGGGRRRPGRMLSSPPSAAGRNATSSGRGASRLPRERRRRSGRRWSPPRSRRSEPRRSEPRRPPRSRRSVLVCWLDRGRDSVRVCVCVCVVFVPSCWLAPLRRPRPRPPRLPRRRLRPDFEEAASRSAAMRGGAIKSRMRPNRLTGAPRTHGVARMQTCPPERSPAVEPCTVSGQRGTRRSGGRATPCAASSTLSITSLALRDSRPTHGYRNTIVLLSWTRMRSSMCQRTARASTTRSISRPSRARSSSVLRWVTRTTSCSMIGPSSSSSVA